MASKEEIAAFIAREFPQTRIVVEAVGEQRATISQVVDESDLRPGGTVSGPSMFALADLAMYAVLLGMIGPVALAVTTNASIDFMRKPEAGRDLIGYARLHKLGKTLAVGDVLIRNAGSEAVLARSSMTYAIPPRREPPR